MKKNIKKTRIVLAFSVVLAILLSITFFFANGFVEKKSKEVFAIVNELEDYLSRDGAISILKNKIKETKERREELKSYFVGRDDLPEFAKRLEFIGSVSRTSVEIKRFTQNGNRFAFDVSSKGTFSNTMHLISLMENLPFKVEFKKAYINTTKPIVGKGARSLEWTGNFSIELIGFVEN